MKGRFYQVSSSCVSYPATHNLSVPFTFTCQSGQFLLMYRREYRMEEARNRAVTLNEFDIGHNGIKHRNTRDLLNAEEWV